MCCAAADAHVGDDRFIKNAVHVGRVANEAMLKRAKTDAVRTAADKAHESETELISNLRATTGAFRLEVGVRLECKASGPTLGSRLEAAFSEVSANFDRALGGNATQKFTGLNRDDLYTIMQYRVDKLRDVRHALADAIDRSSVEASYEQELHALVSFIGGWMLHRMVRAARCCALVCAPHTHLTIGAARAISRGHWETVSSP